MVSRQEVEQFSVEECCSFLANELLCSEVGPPIVEAREVFSPLRKPKLGNMNIQLHKELTTLVEQCQIDGAADTWLDFLGKIEKQAAFEAEKSAGIRKLLEQKEEMMSATGESQSMYMGS